MKKVFKNIFKFLFLIILALTLVACGDNGEKENENENEKDLSKMTASEEAVYYGLEEGTYYRVTFTNDGEQLLVGIVLANTNVLYVQGIETAFPTIEAREGYSGKWKYASLNNIKKDVENNYIWKAYTYKVKFYDEGIEYSVIEVDYGTVLTEADLPKIEAGYGDVSVSWNITLPYTVTGHATINAVHEEIDFADVANTDFDAYMDELFYYVLGDDPLSINFNLYHPENFYKEGVFDFDECFFTGYTFSEEDEAEYYKEMKEIVSELESYDNSTITKDQYLSKIVLLDYYNKSLAYEGFYYYGTLLGSYLGYQAQLPTTLAEYRFDNEKCINDYLSYIQYTKSIFEEIVKFENEKAEAGMPLTDVIINRVIEQCDDFINVDSANPNFLIPVITEKINNCTFLTEEEKVTYIAMNTEYVNTYFVNAYVYLRNELENMLGREDDVVLDSGEEYVGSFAQMENGKDYYTALIQDNLGTTMTVDEIYEYLKKLLNVNLGVYFNNSDLLKEYRAGNIMQDNDLTLDTLIPFFMNAIDGEFPELSVELQYSISQIDSSLQENSSPAMYFISPIDDNLTESIYVNPSTKDLTYPSTYMYTTIAHEGYPGHLYQNVYMKNLDTLPDVRKLIGYSSYAEGWAVHVENYVLTYVFDESYYDIMLRSNSTTYLIIGMLDIGVNYYGWSLEEADNFLSQYFSLEADELLDLYYDVTEIPTNYLMYYFSVFQFEDIQDDFKSLMGDEYSDLLYHTAVLNAGSCSFDVLRYYVLDYAKEYLEANK